MGHGPEAEHNLVFRIVNVLEFFQVCVDKLILLVVARLFAIGNFHDLGQRSINQINIKSLKLPEKNTDIFKGFQARYILEAHLTD